MSADVIQAEYETLQAIVQRFDENASSQSEAVGRIRQRMEALRASWQGQAAERFFGEMEGEVLPAYGRLVAALEESAATTREIARLLREAEEEAAALFVEKVSKAPGHAVPLAVPYPPFRDPPPWEEEGFGWWAETFERQHGRRPNSADYRDFRLAWALSGEGQVQWSDADWEAFYYARELGAERWIEEGALHGPLTGQEALREVKRLTVEEHRSNWSNRPPAEFQQIFEETARLAAELYGIDLGQIGDLVVLQELRDNATYSPNDGTVTFSGRVFTMSVSEFVLFLGHEAMHARQHAEGRLYTGVDEWGNSVTLDEQGANLNELEAWRWQLANISLTGASAEEVADIEQQIDYYYNLLTPENQQRADRGEYIIPGVETADPVTP